METGKCTFFDTLGGGPNLGVPHFGVQFGTQTRLSNSRATENGEDPKMGSQRGPKRGQKGVKKGSFLGPKWVKKGSKNGKKGHFLPKKGQNRHFLDFGKKCKGFRPWGVQNPSKFIFTPFFKPPILVIFQLTRISDPPGPKSLALFSVFRFLPFFDIFGPNWTIF